MVFDIWNEPFMMAFMNVTITLDKAGRVVIPKTLRDELHLEPGDALELETEGDRVTLRAPYRNPPQKGTRRVGFSRTRQAFLG
jgi:AbrB family looped-hinge helix DNA binding protein